MKSRLIVFFLTATQCFLAGCNPRDIPQRREPQDTFPPEQQPLSTPTRGDTERNGGNDTERDRGNDTNRNRDSDTDRNRDSDIDRDGDSERGSNTERDRGGESTRQKKSRANSTEINRVHVTTHEMAIRLSQSSVSAGKVEFVVTNASKIPHEMAVIKTDLAVNKLPLTQNGLDKLKTGQPFAQYGGQKIGEINTDELRSGATKLLTLNLKPGTYLIVSNRPGFQAGMKMLAVK